MRSCVARLVVGPLVVLLVACLAGAVALAVSQSDTAYYDGYQDLEGIDAARSQNVVLDALGGVRLKTIGAATPTRWTSLTDFTAVPPAVGALTGLSTLDAAATPGSLKLLSSPLAFRRTQTGPVLSAAPPLSVDGFGVGGMCVQRVETTYYMWYTGVPENEYAQSIYLATSTDGLTWTKEPTPVLERGADGSFDERQLGKPTVVYDATNVEAPFRMWYAGEGDLGGSIGYATSLDGRAWTKYVPESATEPAPVYAPGKIGMADSYRVTHPCVLIANGVYFMWYTADDSNNKRVAYATSVDGLNWDRGGVVFDVGTGNYSEGAFAPAVVRTGLETPDPADDAFHMIFTGNKIVAGGDIQSKLINADSDDGVTWTAGNIAFSAAGGDTAFDGYNVSQPAILYDALDAIHPYKMWYVGNNPDDNGNYHDRIGLAYQKQPNSVSQWEKVPGLLAAPYFESWVTLGEQGTAFDSMKVADLRGVAKPAAAGTGVYGFYSGTNAADFKQRIGVAQSADGGLTWTDANAHATLVDAGPAAAFDEGGVACPSPVTNPAGGWWLFHTSFDVAGTPSIGLHAVSEDLATVTRTATAPVIVSGGLFDAAGQADPWAYADGPQLVVFYAGMDALGVWSICGAASPTGDPMTLAGMRQVLAPTPGSYDAAGLRKPVAHKMPDGTWRLLYAAIGEDGVSRIAYATSPDGMTWTKQGLVMTESTAAYDFAEGGVEPCSAGPVGSGEGLFFTGIDRFGWTRIGKADAAGAGYLDGGAAEYQLDNATARDWRRILWTPATQPAGDSVGAQIWVSYYPTYSGDWSAPFPMTSDTDLPFLLTVEDMRWQVRMTSTDPAVSPRLDELTVNHAPIQFPATGKAVTLPIGPPDGLYLLSWGDLTIDADIPGGTTVSVTVQDDAGADVIAKQPLVAGAAIPLTGAAPLGAKLVAVIEMTSNDPARDLTPKLKSLGAGYTSTTTPAQMTLIAAKTLLTYGASTTLTGTLFSDPTPLVTDDLNTTPLAGQTVTVKAHVAGSTGYTTVGTVTTAADGTFTLGVKPTAVTTYRAEWPGGTIDTVVYPPASAGVRVDVKAKVTIGVSKYNKRVGKYYLYRLGRTVYVKGAVSPNHYRLDDGVTAGKVSITVYKYKSTGWVKIKRVTRSLTTTSKYTWSWKPSARGKYRLTTTFKGDPTHLAATTAYKYVKVY